jgi:hypothetical protein
MMVVTMAETQHSRASPLLLKAPSPSQVLTLVPVQILYGLGQAPLQVAAACIS